LLFPVPAYDRLQIVMLNPGQPRVEARLYDNRGSLQRSFAFDNARYDLEVSGLRPGFYILHLESEGAILRKKILVLRD